MPHSLATIALAADTHRLPGPTILSTRGIDSVPSASAVVSSTLVREAMSGAFDLRVPLEINLAHGPSWAAAKG